MPSTDFSLQSGRRTRNCKSPRQVCDAFDIHTKFSGFKFEVWKALRRLSRQTNPNNAFKGWGLAKRIERDQNPGKCDWRLQQRSRGQPLSTSVRPQLKQQILKKVCHSIFFPSSVYLWHWFDLKKWEWLKQIITNVATVQLYMGFVLHHSELDFANAQTTFDTSCGEHSMRLLVACGTRLKQSGSSSHFSHFCSKVQWRNANDADGDDGDADDGDCD